ncbi:MAG: cysteine-rich small domain-containing protein [Candidatus Hydrothermarchaeales archaeon]
MLEPAKAHITKSLESGGLGTKYECEYYPCHFEEQDCTWCFCPFYPCLDEKTKGKYVASKRTGKGVWSCIDCHWIHKKDVSEMVLEKMKTLKDWTELDKCNRIRLLILGD